MGRLATMNTIALGLLKNEEVEFEERRINATSRGAYVNCAIIAMLYTHSIGNKQEHDGGV